MEFINLEEFKNQPKEIQKVFMEWWQPQQFDLYLFDKHFLQIVKKYNEDFILPYKGNNVWEEKIQCIPLFTEGQLRKFIEDKTGFHLEMSSDLETGIYIADFYKNNKSRHAGRMMIKTQETDLLKAYWEVACEIAKESTENE